VLVGVEVVEVVEVAVEEDVGIVVDVVGIVVDVVVFAGVEEMTSAAITITTMTTTTAAAAMVETPLLCNFMEGRYAALCITLFILWELKRRV
jgi:hypothetical protein